MHVLGIDVGTSSVKSVLFDTASGVILAVAGCEYPLRQPQPGYAEQHPDDWWAACVDAVRAVLAQVAGSQVRAIGLTGQMHGTVLLDAAGVAVRPAIIWADGRSAEAARALAASIGPERYAALAGTLPAAGFMAATLCWLQAHEPRALDAASIALLPKDVVRLRLTGEIATDASDAAGTALFDIGAGAWSSEIVGAAGLPERLLPPVLDSAAVAGSLTRSAAATLGLTAGIPVVAGCADQPAQALANGVLTPGLASVTIGTGGQVSIPQWHEPGRAPHTDPRLHVFTHAAPGRVYILGAMLAAGLNLRWYRGLVGLDGQADAYSLLSDEAGTITPGAEGLLYLPYLAGERTPHMDALARGAFIGLSLRHGRAHLARAVMEGVAFGLLQTLELAMSLSETPTHTVIAAGGGAESGVWRQILADVLGLPLKRTLLVEQTCVGAALLAGVGAGAFRDVDEASAGLARYGPVTEPDVARTRRYAALYAQYLALYPLLREQFHALATYGLDRSGPS